MKNCDSAKPSKFIPDLDMNNLCGWGMSKFLPYGGFKCLKNVDNFNVNAISEKGLMNYANWIMINCQLQKNLQFLMTSCQIIVKKLQTNIE